MAYSTVAVSQKPLEAVTRKFKFISELWNTDVRMAEERSFCLSDPDPRGVSCLLYTSDAADERK